MTDYIIFKLRRTWGAIWHSIYKFGSCALFSSQPIPQTSTHPPQFIFATMSTPTWRADLLAPFLALPQGDSIQAECMDFTSFSTGRAF